MDFQFYIVATPIGNMSDITLRAIEVLKNVDYIACEDTRVTRVLCEKYGFTAKLFDCHKFNEKERSEKIISYIDAGNYTSIATDITGADIARLRAQLNLTWDESIDLKTAKLVPRQIHNVSLGGISHSGGISYLKILEKLTKTSNGG